MRDYSGWMNLMRPIYHLGLTLVVIAGPSGCGGAEGLGQAQRGGKPDQEALDSAAVWSFEMPADFYHQLRGWVFRPDETIVAAGSREISVFAPDGRRTLIDSAGENQMLTLAADGSHLGRLQLRQDVVERFELRTLAGETVWSQEGRGHHYYLIGPQAGAVAGLSSDVAHPGKPGSMGTIVVYDATGQETGRFQCPTPGSTRFSADGSTLLAECRDSALFLLDLNGREVGSLPGNYRNFEISSDGSVVAAAPFDRPTELTIQSGDGQPRSVSFEAPVRQLAVAPDGELIAVAAGSVVYAVDPRDGSALWQVELRGPAPLPTSLSLGPDGLIAVGVLNDSDRALQGGEGPYLAAVALFRDGELLRRIEFEVEALNAWTPSVFMDPEGMRLVVSVPNKAWALDVRSLIGQ